MEENERPFEERTDAELLEVSRQLKVDVTEIDILLKKRALSRLASVRHLVQEQLTMEDVTIDDKAGKIVVIVSMGQWGVDDTARARTLEQAIARLPGVTVKRKLHNIVDFSAGYLEVTLDVTEKSAKPERAVSKIQKGTRGRTAKVQKAERQKGNS